MDEPYMTTKYLDLIKLNNKLHISEAREKRMAEMTQKSKQKNRRRGR